MRLSRFLLAAFLLAVLCAPVVPARADFIYLSTTGGAITRTDTQTQVTTTFATAGLSLPQGLAFDSAGNLYVANFSSSTIEKFTPGGVGSVFASTGLSNPVGLAFDSAGNLFVSNQGDGTIEKFTPGGVGSVFASTGFGGLEGLAIDASDNLYLAVDGNQSDSIEKFTPAGVGSVFASLSPQQRVVGLAFNTAGVLYGVGDVSNEIARFTPAGVRSVFVSTAPNVSLGLAFGTGGDLYVASLTSPITKFTLGGVGSGFGNGTTGYFVAFQSTAAVPEPSGLILMGLGGLGLSAYARVRRGRGVSI